MAQNILGIDIGTYSVKMVLMERTFDEFQILQFVEQPLNMQLRLPHDEAAALAIEQALQNNPMPADIVSVGLPGHILSSRVLDMPFTNQKKLAQIIEFELEGYIPFGIEDLVVDYHVLARTESSSRVLCAYVQQERFAKYLESLAKAGTDPKYCGADVIDLANIAQVTMVPSDGLYALCDVGHSKTNICIMKGRELQYARTVGIGGVHFTRALQRTFNVNYEKAESLKISRGKVCVREQDTDQISRILGHIASELVSGIKQAFLAFDNIAGRQGIAAIYCTGGASRLGGLLDFFSFHLRTNVLELDSLHGIRHGLEDTAEANRVMTQVLCAALRPVFSNRLPRINFRKGAYAYKQDIQTLTSELKYVAILAGVILLLGAGYYFYAGHYYAQKRASIDNKIARVLKTDFPELAPAKGRSFNLATNLRQAKTKYEALRDQASALLGGGGPSVLAIMQEVSQKLPKKKEVKLAIEQFSYLDDFVRVTATTDDPLNVAKVSEALKESTLFPDIQTTDAQAKPGNQWSFQMTINLKPSDEGTTKSKSGGKSK